MTNNELLRAARRVGEEAGLIDLWSAEELLAVASYIEDTARSSQTSESDVADTMIILIRSFRRIKQLENKYRKIRNAPEGKNNNWFKMHGYPMRREIAGRHGRRKKHEISITENNKTSVECEGSEGRGRCEKSERAECTVQRSNSAGEFPAGSGSDQLQRDRRSHEPDRCEIHKPSTETGRMKRNQGSTARRRYSGGWPSRKK